MDPEMQQPEGIVPEAPVEAGLSQDEMKANLQGMMEKIEGKMGDFKAGQFASANKVQEYGGQSLREIFALLEAMGVDPSNPDEIRSFLDELKATKPALAEQLESALQVILGEDAEAAVSEEEAAPEGEVAGDVPPADMNTNLDAASPESV